MPSLAALFLTAMVMPFYIKWLKNLQINQFLREDGPKSHAHKTKTPTMGGLVFMVTTLVVCLVMSIFSRGGLVVHAPYYVVISIGFLCGVVGLLDDSAKVRHKANKGISGYVRLGIETFLGLAIAVAMICFNEQKLLLPSSIFNLCSGLLGQLGLDTLGAEPVATVVLPLVLYLALAAFLCAATTNAVNLHDGMDGLAAGTSCQVFATMAVILYCTGQFSYATISATVAGALLGFLVYNRNPAQIFMGDTGSLFIGGLMACLTIAGGIVVWFVPLSLIYVAEALSVMVQVVYFKLTKPYTPEKPMSAPALLLYKLTKRLPGEGKRLFRMAPLHHHYEAVLAEKGWAEWQVVAAFWLVQFLLCGAVLLTNLALIANFQH